MLTLIYFKNVGLLYRILWLEPEPPKLDKNFDPEPEPRKNEVAPQHYPELLINSCAGLSKMLFGILKDGATRSILYTVDFL
jgi:hypothetical protein